MPQDHLNRGHGGECCSRSDGMKSAMKKKYSAYVSQTNGKLVKQSERVEYGIVTSYHESNDHFALIEEKERTASHKSVQFSNDVLMVVGVAGSTGRVATVVTLSLKSMEHQQQVNGVGGGSIQTPRPIYSWINNE